MVNLWILNQFKGYKSCNTEASLMKLILHQHITVIDIYFQFYENLFSSYVVMANFMDFKPIEWL